jgi:hypothetical protein
MSASARVQALRAWPTECADGWTVWIWCRCCWLPSDVRGRFQDSPVGSRGMAAAEGGLDRAQPRRLLGENAGLELSRCRVVTKPPSRNGGRLGRSG